MLQIQICQRIIIKVIKMGNRHVYVDNYIKPNKVSINPNNPQELKLEKIFGIADENFSKQLRDLSLQSKHDSLQGKVRQRQIQQIQICSYHQPHEQQLDRQLQVGKRENKKRSSVEELDGKQFISREIKIRKEREKEKKGKDFYGSGGVTNGQRKQEKDLFLSCGVSPVRNESKEIEESRTHVFKSRHQIPYFRLK